MIYGYARVSTAAQDETGQVRQLKAAGCETVFREKITHTTADRPQLAKLMKALVPGDVVITPAVDRLWRGTDQETEDGPQIRDFKSAWNRINSKIQIRSYSGLLRQVEGKLVESGIST
jgi:DNA invertase Pin-like site-specific DNA recombinase